MRSFSDNAGRTWTLSLTLGAVERVKALLDVNLLELESGDPPLLTRIGTDVILLCDVIFALIKPQADSQGVSDEEWAEAMGGDAILSAQAAFYEEMASFFLSLGRPDVVKAAATQRRMIELVVEANEERLGQVDVEAEVAGIFGASPSSSPPSPEPMPGPTT
jgi:hypothetical protein